MQRPECRRLAAAIADLAAIAAAPSATAADLELLARAHDHAGDVAAAAAARARGIPVELDERTLGFLEFPTVTAARATPAAGTSR